MTVAFWEKSHTWLNRKKLQQGESTMTTVYVMSHHENESTYLEVHTTYEGARSRIFVKMLADIEKISLDEDREDLRTAIRQRDYRKALQVWAENTDESFDIDTCAVCDTDHEDDLEASLKAAENNSEEE